jgi:hypothetical protein
MTTTEPVLHGPLTPEAHERLLVIIALIKLRDHLIKQGWTQDQLWADQDAPYSGQGPTCLMGGALVAIGRGDLTQGDDLDTVIDNHPVAVALDDTLRETYPPSGGLTGYHAMLFDLPDNAPGDRLAVWNDTPGRTVREVIALIDATIERLESA